ncbi:MAG: hypothetical protein JWO31_1194 [Phycisphaerales bacterium]|nr:hypothetical protein [Phycisphaerales bacterium]
MAVDYPTLFARLGKVVRAYNAHRAFQSGTLLGPGVGADAILDQFEGRRDLVKSVQADFEGFAAAVAGWGSRLTGYADATLADLRAELLAPSASPATILPMLAARMVADAQTVAANAIATPTVTPAGGNAGNGVLVVSKQNAAGVDDERIVTEAVAVRCVGDRFGGNAAGAESFQLVGSPATNPANYLPPGSGTGALAVADGSSLLANGTFEAFSANLPTGWSLTAGTAGTNTGQELTNYHRGAGALKLLGNGVATTVTLRQAIPAGRLAVGARYVAAVWLRRSGTVTAGSTLRVGVTGTGFSADLFNADPATLTTSYALLTAFFTVPAAPPADLRFEFAWTAANAAGAAAVVLADDAVVVAPVEFGHARYALFAGSADFVRGDAFAVATASDGAGTFQSWFARVYDVALPSAAGGAETIADALAE